MSFSGKRFFLRHKYVVPSYINTMPLHHLCAETLSSPHHPTPILPPHGPQYESCPQGHQGEAFGGLLQRYLDDAYERSLQPTDRRRHQSGSLSSHDHDDWSTSSCGSPTRGLDGRFMKDSCLYYTILGSAPPCYYAASL